MRRFGLADGLGLVAALTALAWFPGFVDPLTYPKLLVLATGGLALAPVVAYRWVKGGRPSIGVSVVVAACLGIVIWGLVSSVASAAPWAVSLFGWWGRGDGWLAWFGAATLLMGAACLSVPEVRRTITWLLGGASIVALIGLLQAVGVQVPTEGMGGSVVGTMGNTNFAAGYFAIMGVLALGFALAPGRLAERIWGGALFIILAILALLTDSQQGPAALAAGVVVLGIAAALLYRGRFRAFGLAAAGVVFVTGLALLVASFFAVGPLARLWAEQTFDIRQQYWLAAINIMNGLPVFGTGPDSFSRYVGEFRPESYVELLGPTLRVSAAHNVALQFGAVLGYPGLVLWLILFGGIGVLLILRLMRVPVRSIALTASVSGAFAAYVIQGMVSIDMLPILATGWIVAGLALAVSRESLETLPTSSQNPASVPKTRKAKAAAAAEAAHQSSRAQVKSPAWVPVTGATLALVAAVLVGQQAALANTVRTISSQEEAIDFITNPMAPCPLRVQVTQQVIQQLPADISVPATLAATDTDRRCPPMINFASDVLIQQGRYSEANTYTSEGTLVDPLFDLAWVLRSRYFMGSGNEQDARRALAQAERVQKLYPESAQDTTLISDLVNDIEGS